MRITNGKNLSFCFFGRCKNKAQKLISYSKIEGRNGSYAFFYEPNLLKTREEFSVVFDWAKQQTAGNPIVMSLAIGSMATSLLLIGWRSEWEDYPWSWFWPASPLHNKGLALSTIIASVADPWHVGVDPDPDPYPDPSIFNIDLQDANKEIILKKVFLHITFWTYFYIIF